MNGFRYIKIKKPKYKKRECMCIIVKTSVKSEIEGESAKGRKKVVR